MQNGIAEFSKVKEPQAGPNPPAAQISDMNTKSSARDGVAQVTLEPIKITAPRIRRLICEIEGITPYVSNKMGQTALLEMREALTNPGTKAKKKRAARNFDLLYRESMHTTADGWHGVPTNAFLQAMIRSCKVVGFEMTDAKMALSVKPHGISLEQLPIVKIQGEPRPLEMRVVTQRAVNISVRAAFQKWGISGLCIEFDRDIFTKDDVANLLTRAGRQVGVGAGRPFSANSAGMGWGIFEVRSWTCDDR